MKIEIIESNISKIEYEEDNRIGSVIRYKDENYFYIGKMPVSGDVSIKKDVELDVQVIYKKAFLNISTGEISFNSVLINLLRKDCI